MKPARACFEPERLFAYTARMLDPREEGAVKSHLASCAACRDVIAGFENVSRMLDEWKPVQPSPWFDARARARMASGGSTRSWLSVFSGRMWAGVIAAVAVVAVATSLAVWRLSRPPSPASGAPPQIAKSNMPNAAPGVTAIQTSTPTDTMAQSQTASQEIDLYRNLKVLENYDMLANFDVLSELPPARDKTSD